MTVTWNEKLPSPEYRLLQYVDRAKISAFLLATKMRIEPYVAIAEIKLKALLKTATEINDGGEKELTKS